MLKDQVLSQLPSWVPTFTSLLKLSIGVSLRMLGPLSFLPWGLAAAISPHPHKPLEGLGLRTEGQVGPPTSVSSLGKETTSPQNLRCLQRGAL